MCFSTPSVRMTAPRVSRRMGTAWYLVAAVEHEPRTYRVSRIGRAEVLDRACRRPEQFDLAAYWERSASEFRDKLPRFYATFLAGDAVMRWVRYRGWRLEEEMPEGNAVRVRLRFDAEEEALQFALSFGGAVEVLEPEELRGKVLAGARAIIARYGFL
ncbi:MAG: WYL domain-containing protein [Candidatus Sulfopaludibacter sp.]|nr:WYL domain-containing protein [Candidatus Sulfopaludibacter sp.]